MDKLGFEKIALDFLLFDSFGISLDNFDDPELLKFAAINKAYGDASRHVLSLEGGNDKFRKDGTDFLMEKLSPEKDAFELLVEFMNKLNEYNDCKDKMGNGRKKAYTGVTQGHVQKWINMTYKYLSILDSIKEKVYHSGNMGYVEFAKSERYHIPVDSYILQESGITDTKWGRIENYKDIEGIIKESPSFINSNKSVFEWENEKWIGRAKGKSDSIVSKYEMTYGNALENSDENNG